MPEPLGVLNPWSWPAPTCHCSHLGSKPEMEHLSVSAFQTKWKGIENNIIYPEAGIRSKSAEFTAK